MSINMILHSGRLWVKNRVMSPLQKNDVYIGLRRRATVINGKVKEAATSFMREGIMVFNAIICVEGPWITMSVVQKWFHEMFLGQACQIEHCTDPKYNKNNILSIKHQLFNTLKVYPMLFYSIIIFCNKRTPLAFYLSFTWKNFLPSPHLYLSFTTTN
jgi:hypothetical protein